MSDDVLDVRFSGSELSVIVPAYNESATIANILQQVCKALPEAEVIVVDDGSTDGTGQIAKELAVHLNVLVHPLEKNSGKGAAVKHGVTLASRKWVVIQDADCEYDPNEIRELLISANDRNRLAVYGSRYKRRGRVSGGAWLNYLGVQFLAIFEWLLYGQLLSDPHTCYKMLRRDLFQSLDIQSNGFELCAEINSKLLRQGIEIHEVPISYAPRDVAAGKKIRLRDFFVAVWTYMRYRIGTDLRAKTAENQQLPKSNYVYVCSRILIGCLLLLAGLSKFSPLNAMPIASWLVLPKMVVLFWGVFEFLLGWMCLTMVPHRLLRQVLIGLFSIFLVVLGVQWWNGEERCQCLGSLSVPLGLMATIDTRTLVSLFFYRLRWERVVGLPIGFVGDQVRNLRFVLPVLLLGCIFWFGSLDAAKAYLSGENILVDSLTRYAGEVNRNEFVDVTYRLSNPTHSPVRVLGAKASCSCIAILDLPTTVDPKSDKLIRLRVTGRTVGRLQRESAELVFDDSALRIVLNATALVRPNR